MKKQRELTYGVARAYVDNYRGINDPKSLSYCDGHAIVWLEDQAKKYGYGDRISTMNAACRIFLRNNKPAPKGGKKIFIEIIKYMGKNGTFANHEEVMYRAEIVGVNGKRRGAGDGMDDTEGNPDRKYADQDAAGWAKLLGCKIVFVDKTTKTA